ncbi:MAG: C10 family peptidase, partial [Calditrichaceae bacterium]
PPDIIQRNNQAWQTVLSKSSVETEAAKFMQWPEPGSTTTGGWVETLWKQREPYNDMCPVDPDKGIRSPTGCVANTMAQIINYHKQIGDFQLMPSDRYYLSDMKIDDDSTRLDFPSFNKLNSFLDSIRIKYEGGSILNNKDIAALNFVCGISMNMFYNYNESGTTGDFTYVLRDRRQDMPWLLMDTIPMVFII